MDTGIIAAIGALIVALVGGLLAAIRSNGKKDAQIDEAERKKERDAAQIRTINDAVATRSKADESARTDPIADIDAAPSMRDRQRD